MELSGLKKRWKERREAHEERELDIELNDRLAVDTSSDDESNNTDDVIFIKQLCESPFQEQYDRLRKSSLAKATRSDNHDSLLLPSFVQPRDNVKVYVKGASDNVKGVASQIAAQQYISQLAKERDKALEMARSYRNYVDELQAKNRRLHCEKNDRVDVIRITSKNNYHINFCNSCACIHLVNYSSIIRLTIGIQMLTLSEPKSNSNVCSILAHLDIILLTGIKQASESELNRLAERTIEFLYQFLRGWS